jgi:FAD synthase
MIIVEGGARLPDSLRGGALALGNFDGVHRGHQAVIGSAVRAARAAGAPALVATFDPHPSRHFRPDTAPFALTSRAQKLRLFAMRLCKVDVPQATTEAGIEAVRAVRNEVNDLRDRILAIAAGLDGSTVEAD